MRRFLQPDTSLAITGLTPAQPPSIIPVVDDYELIAQEVSGLAEKVSRLEKRVTDLLGRMADVEKVDRRLEEAALTTSRALAEISSHWDAVYEAMRRRDASQQP